MRVSAGSKRESALVKTTREQRSGRSAAAIVTAFTAAVATAAVAAPYHPRSKHPHQADAKKKLMSSDGGSGPLSYGIGVFACDLQRSVNILVLLLDTDADDADEAMHMLSIQHAMDYIVREGFRSACELLLVLMHRSRSKFILNMILYGLNCMFAI